jgi:hypothetical protein
MINLELHSRHGLPASLFIGTVKSHWQKDIFHNSETNNNAQLKIVKHTGVLLVHAIYIPVLSY